MTEASLYDRLGGAFAIPAVVDHFSDALVRNLVVGETSKNPALREWHTNNLGRLPGLKFMRTVWVCEVAGGPQKYAATKAGSTSLGLEEAHRDLKISPAEFEEVEVVDAAVALGEHVALEPLEPPDRLSHQATHFGEVPPDRQDLLPQTLLHGLVDAARKRGLEARCSLGERLDPRTRSLERRL